MFSIYKMSYIVRPMTQPILNCILQTQLVHVRSFFFFSRRHEKTGNDSPFQSCIHSVTRNKQASHTQEKQLFLRASVGLYHIPTRYLCAVFFHRTVQSYDLLPTNNITFLLINVLFVYPFENKSEILQWFGLKISFKLQLQDHLFRQLTPGGSFSVQQLQLLLQRNMHYKV